jgi:hypothetical protein
MTHISNAAACCAQSRLAAYDETNKSTLHKETTQAEHKQKFDWEKNSANLRKLADSEREQEIAEAEGASEAND